MSNQRIASEAVRNHGAVQKIPELTSLLNLLHPGNRVLEIGSYKGGTLYAWQQAGCKVWSIDLERPKNLWGATFYRGDSNDVRAYRAIKEATGGGLDMVFIDADHRYKPVLTDFYLYCDLIHPGGMVCLHDICHHPDRSMGVERAWKMIKRIEKGNFHEFISEPFDWGGIGVAQNLVRR